MADNDNKGGGSLLRECTFVIITFALMIGAFTAVEILQEKEIVSEDSDLAFILTEFVTFLSRFSLVLLVVWLYKGLGFPKTIGRDFAERFNRGWNEMSDADATKWMIIVFLGLFLGAALLFSGS